MGRKWRRVRRAAAAGALAPVALAGPTAAAEMDQVFGFFQVEQLEYRLSDGEDALHLDAQGWVGGDDHKAWLKLEGEKPRHGRLEQGEAQLLYSRRISDFFDAQAGLRYDIAPDPERAFAVLGLQGLATYFFEVDAALFLSHEGELSGRLEAEYELPITQRLVLQPTAELNVAARSVEERGIGSGLNDIELGLRLRYEIVRELAPYVGVNWEHSFGETADLAREEGEDDDALSLVLGIRFWF
jgi:copper resistance protein B